MIHEILVLVVTAQKSYSLCAEIPSFLEILSSHVLVVAPRYGLGSSRLKCE